jgi:putative phosphoribosyl transferase
MAPVEGRTVVVVDDGLATGLTDLAAVRALKSRNPRRIILAVPVGAADSVRRLAAVADEVVCPHVPHNFTAVGLWYEDFAQVSDDEVVDLLARVRVEQQPPDEAQQDAAHHREVAFDVADRRVMASLVVPERGARGLILFAHGSGSSRHSPRNLQVAEELAAAGYASLLMDLLTPDEAADRARVFDTRLLADRLLAVTRWVRGQPGMGRLPIGYFGASTGAAAALRAAARLGPGVAAVVSRGGRPDLAEEALPQVTAPTLLVVGGDDWNVIELNDQAATLLRCPHDLAIVPRAGHLFEEPGALERVAQLAIGWFDRYLVMDTELGEVA